MKNNHSKTNIFFYKYFNNNIEDESIIEFVSNELYDFIMLKINKYNLSKQNKMNYDQYTYWLFNTINEDFSKDVIFLKNNINLK